MVCKKVGGYKLMKGLEEDKAELVKGWSVGMRTWVRFPEPT